MRKHGLVLCFIMGMDACNLLLQIRLVLGGKCGLVVSKLFLQGWARARGIKISGRGKQIRGRASWIGGSTGWKS